MLEGTPHLREDTIARLLHGDLPGTERQVAEAHLADCPACRHELAEVRAIVRAAPERRRLVPRRLIAAAAAAVLLFFVWPWADRAPEPLPHRDPALTSTLAPRAVRPVGAVAAVRALEWTAVPGALRYRVTLFDAEGEAAWQSVVADTAVLLPDSIALAPAEYYWQVKAEASPGRWVESELIPFTLKGARTP